MSHACSTSLITLVIRPLLLAFMNNSSIFYALDLWIQHACIHFCKCCTVHIYISHVANEQNSSDSDHDLFSVQDDIYVGTQECSGKSFLIRMIHYPMY